MATDKRTTRAGVSTERDAIGYDTPTGTDPDAKYDHAGWEDKSGGQAFAHDEELVEELIEATDGDLSEAERRFEEESAAAPALARQRDPGAREAADARRPQAQTPEGWTSQ